MINQKHVHLFFASALSIVIIILFVLLGITLFTPAPSKNDAMKMKILNAEITALPKEDDLAK